MFDYSKLNGKIKEVFDTQELFAKAINVSTTSVNKKLNNKTLFTQTEIAKAMEVLNIEQENVSDYFFNKKVEKTQ